MLTTLNCGATELNGNKQITINNNKTSDFQQHGEAQHSIQPTTYFQVLGFTSIPRLRAILMGSRSTQTTHCALALISVF